MASLVRPLAQSSLSSAGSPRTNSDSRGRLSLPCTRAEHYRLARMVSIRMDTAEDLRCLDAAAARAGVSRMRFVLDVIRVAIRKQNARTLAASRERSR